MGDDSACKCQQHCSATLTTVNGAASVVPYVHGSTVTDAGLRSACVYSKWEAGAVTDLLATPAY